MLQFVLEHQNILLKPASLWNGLIKRAFISKRFRTDRLSKE